MIPKFIIGILVLISCVTFVGCKEDLKSGSTAVTPNEQHTVFDSIYGDLTDKEQYFQHFLIEVPSTYQANIDSLSGWISSNQPGGLCFLDWNEDSLVRLKKELDSTMRVQPFYFDNFYSYLDLSTYPYWDVNSKNRASKWTQVFTDGHVGLIDFNDTFEMSSHRKEWLDKWNSEVGAHFVSNHLSDTNVSVDYDRFRSVLKTSDHLLELDLNQFDSVSLDRFRNIYHFKGQFIVTVKTDAINAQLKKGADFVRVQLTPNQSNPIPFSDWRLENEHRSIFDLSTQRILELKAMTHLPEAYKSVKEQKESVRLNLAAQSCALLNNEGHLIPLNNGAHIFSEESISVETDVKNENRLKFSQNNLEDIEAISKKDGVKIVLLPDSLSLQQLEQIKKVKKKQEIIFCFSTEDQFKLLRESPNLVYVHPVLREKGQGNLLVQLFTQQLNLDGDFYNRNVRIEGTAIEKNRLAIVSPSFCGLSRDTLKKIDYAVNSAMNGKAFPGCQIVLAKDGYIFYAKSFGRYTYEDPAPITPESMYDVASLTKVVATTMVGMLLYEEGAFQLLDSLKDYLPDSLADYLRYPSTIRNITFEELFTHQSGLPAGFPVLNYMQYTSSEVGRLDKFYCDRPDSIYSIEVAADFYLEECYRDSMWLRLNQMWLDPSKNYKYSDVNMNTLYFIFKSILHNSPEKFGFKLKKEEQLTRDLFVEYLYKKIYDELGMKNTKYKPLKFYPKNKIVPTENERFWRKQLLQGHVHDPNAALYGGVAGNAGIFSTGHDLAVLCEMLRQKGTYAGKRFFKPETVEKFTSAQTNSFRGLGFNKPSLNTSAFGCASSAPQATFGHTGFTGTCIWVDPVNDISFVFLSNRVYPQVNNRIYQYGIRRNIHQLAYDARLFIEE